MGQRAGANSWGHFTRPVWCCGSCGGPGHYVPEVFLVGERCLFRDLRRGGRRCFFFCVCGGLPLCAKRAPVRGERSKRLCFGWIASGSGAPGGVALAGRNSRSRHSGRIFAWRWGSFSGAGGKFFGIKRLSRCDEMPRRGNTNGPGGSMAEFFGIRRPGNNGFLGWVA